MSKLLPVLALVVPVTAIAVAPGWSANAQNADDQTKSRSAAHRVDILPPDALSDPLPRTESNLCCSADSLADPDFLERLSVLYGYQSDLMAALARDEEETAVRLIDAAMGELGEMIRTPELRDEPRFAEVYRTIVSEYERVYGPSDTLFTAFGDIFDVRSDVFARLESIEDPLLEDITPPALQPVGTTFPMTMNRLVENSMEFLLRERQDVLRAWLKRADTYFPMIEKIFREEGVPDELKYLSMIESGLNPRARSWARAVGMWQFVAATGRYYDLEINAWVDERMDPEKSTRAAARHLMDLYEMYDHDWQVAIAGYNCSPRCIKRAERRARNAGASRPDFWDMYRYLPRETRNYVPLYIATSLITSNPEAYDISLDTRGVPYAYHLVPVTGMLSLRDVAEMAGTDVATIKALNPNLRRDTLPPSTGAFYLRIPTGTYDRFTAAYEALPEAARRPSGEYVVRRGDTLSEIGDEFGVSVSRLMAKNGLRSTNLQIGQRLVVPLGDYSSTVEEVAFTDESRTTVQYPARIPRPIMLEQRPPEQLASNGNAPVKTASLDQSADQKDPGTDGSGDEEAPSGADVRIVHTVRRGDTLSEIANRYGVRISQIKGWNSLATSRINRGQKLTIYTDGRPARPAGDQPISYRVKRGDTLIEIAQAYDVTVTQLRQWNNILGSNIRIGQRLSIHPGSEGSEYVTHTVRRGDTLIELAQSYGTSVAKIKTWNNLSSNTIRVGQRIQIYR